MSAAALRRVVASTTTTVMATDGVGYTLTLPKAAWRHARALAILRGLENQELVLRWVLDELERDRRGEGLRHLESYPPRSEPQTAQTFVFPHRISEQIDAYVSRVQDGQRVTKRMFFHSIIRDGLERARLNGNLITNL